MMKKMIAAEIEPLPNRANEAARALQQLEFRVLHIGSTISVQAPESLWRLTFNISFETRRKTVLPETKGGEVTYKKAITAQMRIPTELQNLISGVMFVEPPQLYREDLIQ